MSGKITMPSIPEIDGMRTAPFGQAFWAASRSSCSSWARPKQGSPRAAGFLPDGPAELTVIGSFAGASEAHGRARELLLVSLSAYAGGLSTRAELDDLERQALQRENEIRSLAPAEWAAKLPSDDDTWQGLNSLRHALIDKELDGGLTPEEKAILGALELLSDRRIREENTASAALAEELLAHLGKDPD